MGDKLLFSSLFHINYDVFFLDKLLLLDSWLRYFLFFFCCDFFNFLISFRMVLGNLGWSCFLEKLLAVFGFFPILTKFKRECTNYIVDKYYLDSIALFWERLQPLFLLHFLPFSLKFQVIYWVAWVLRLLLLYFFYVYPFFLP